MNLLAYGDAGANELCSDNYTVCVTTAMRTTQGTTLHIRKAARPEAWQQVIYKTLGLNQKPGGTIKTIIPD